MSSWSKDNAIKLKHIMGDSCFICGYNKCKKALHIHHLDPDTKRFEFSRLFMNKMDLKTNIDLLKNELQQCCLVCANCHAELHSNDVMVNLSSTFDVSRWDEQCKICDKCEEKNDNPFYFSCRCASKGGNNKTGTPNKVDWNSVDILLLLHRHEGNYTSAGLELNVTGNAVKKSFRRQTGFDSYKEYTESKNIFTFDNDEVALNFLLPNIAQIV